VLQFFEKSLEFLRCEITEQPSGRWRILITQPSGYEWTEHFASSETVHKRWRELQTRFIEDGWLGPYGNE